MDFYIRIIILNTALLFTFLLKDGVYGDCPRDVDPCSSSVYSELDEPTRSISYNVTGTNEHDYSTTETWYRSVSGAGGDMPTYPVYTGQCNAYAPIWLNDSLPSAADGITDLAACASFLDDECVRSYTIPVKNCSTYNVYCFSPTLDAFDRYCMGSETECDNGFTSGTGFTPGCEVIAAIGNCPTNIDPCSSSVYVELDEPTRSTRYNVTATNEHDYTLSEEWYRSVSGAGADMSTEVVYTGQCNSYAPIYLRDSLPSESDGITNIIGCASHLADTCIRYYQIPVKNCGDYNVYCLPPVADSFDRYCMGSEIECDYGYTSATGFTPGCEEIAAIGNCSTNIDPCSSTVYVELNEPTRSTSYNVTSTNEHDYSLREEWYRSVSEAGGGMSTDVVYTGQCNAYAPIYLRDSLPSESDGITDIVGCASYLADTCIRYYLIPVKNCGDYTVYCLPPVADTFDRYCIGSELECQVNYTSANGFTPGCVPIEATSSGESRETDSGEKKGIETGLIIVIIVAVAFAIAFITIIVLVYMHKNKSKSATGSISKGNPYLQPPAALTHQTPPCSQLPPYCERDRGVSTHKQEKKKKKSKRSSRESSRPETASSINSVSTSHNTAPGDRSMTPVR